MVHALRLVLVRFSIIDSSSKPHAAPATRAPAPTSSDVVVTVVMPKGFLLGKRECGTTTATNNDCGRNDTEDHLGDGSDVVSASVASCKASSLSKGTRSHSNSSNDELSVVVVVVVTNNNNDTRGWLQGGAASASPLLLLLSDQER